MKGNENNKSGGMWARLRLRKKRDSHRDHAGSPAEKEDLKKRENHKIGVELKGGDLIRAHGHWTIITNKRKKITTQTPANEIGSALEKRGKKRIQQRAGERTKKEKKSLDSCDIPKTNLNSSGLESTVSRTPFPQPEK